MNMRRLAILTIQYIRWQHQATGDRRRDDEFNTFEVGHNLGTMWGWGNCVMYSKNDTMRHNMTQYREKKIYTTQGHCHCDSLTMQRCALLPNNDINCPSGAFFSQISTSEVPEQLGAPVRRGGGSAVGDQTELHSETDHPNHHHKTFTQWPDTVYYHSYTTPYMGWKIHVIDSFRFLIYLMRS